MSIDVIASRIMDELNFVKTVDRSHALIHEGIGYSHSLSTTVIAASTHFCLITTPNTTMEPCFLFNASAHAAASMSLYENPTAASTGVATYTPLNDNRRSTKTATVTIMTVASSDVTSTGTLMESYATGIIGGDIAGGHEWLLAQNEQYLLKINSASTNTIHYNMFWTEDEL